MFILSVNTIIFEGEKAEKYTEKIREILSVREKGSFVSTNVTKDINQIKRL